MNNKNMGVIKWADLFFGLREKREWRRKNVVSVVWCVRIIGSAEMMESYNRFLKDRNMWFLEKEEDDILVNRNDILAYRT